MARILTAGPFVNSDRVSRFLTYVVNTALEGRINDLKESSIGVAVFDRDPSYDPKADPIVRVEARRLRVKLEQYYEGEGKDDPVLIAVPKGRYAPEFIIGWSAVAPAQEPEETREPVPVETPAVAGHRESRWWMWAAAGIAMVAATALIYPRVLVSSLPHQFWSTVFTDDRPTLIVPSDSALILLQNLTQHPVSLSDYASGAYRMDLKSPSGLDEKTLFDLGSRHYTLLPHLAFAMSVARRPEALRSDVRVTFSRDLKMDDLKTSNVILLGAVQGNPWVELFEKNANFAIGFDQATKLHTIRNRSPRGSELAEYRSFPGDPQHADFAVVEMTRNLSGNGSVLVVEGTTSAGNEAAGDFILDDRRFGAFLKSISPHGVPPRFEALLQTTNIGNASPQAKVIAWRRYQ